MKFGFAGLAERERKSLHAGVGEFDLELAISDRLRLPDQLIQPRFYHRAAALVVDVNSVSRRGRLSIDEHAKLHRGASGCRPHQLTFNGQSIRCGAGVCSRKTDQAELGRGHRHRGSGEEAAAILVDFFVHLSLSNHQN